MFFDSYSEQILNKLSGKQKTMKVFLQIKQSNQKF